MELSFFLKGVILGFSIAAPVGPIGLRIIGGAYLPRSQKAAQKVPKIDRNLIQRWSLSLF